MVLIKLAKVSGELIGHDYVMTFGKLHTDGNILQHLCKLIASKTDAEFVALSCLCPSDQLREWYGPAAALLDNIFLEVPQQAIYCPNWLQIEVLVQCLASIHLTIKSILLRTSVRSYYRVKKDTLPLKKSTLQ